MNDLKLFIDVCLNPEGYGIWSASSAVPNRLGRFYYKRPMGAAWFYEPGGTNTPSSVWPTTAKFLVVRLD